MKKTELFRYNHKAVHLYSIKNSTGMSLEVIDIGCSILKLFIPDKNNNVRDVVLGYKNPMSYIENVSVFGAIVGRFANRINKGKFVWQGQEFQLERNDGENHIHGGSDGFAYQIWEHIPNKNKLIFKLDSPHKHANYPGQITCYLSYQLTNDNELVIDYKLTTPDIAFANLTNHSYFNLSGDGAQTIMDHYLKINADKFTEINSTLIPTGKFLPVHNTPMDFRNFKEIGKEIGIDFDQLKFADGYDHNYILNKESNIKAEVFSPISGIKMQIITNCPGLQFYTANAMNGNTIGKTGKTYTKRSGFCLETQFYPDSPNHPEFPQPIIRKNKPLTLQTKYRFGLQSNFL